MKTLPDNRYETLSQGDEPDRERLAECVAFLLLAYHRHHANEPTGAEDD